MNDLTLALQQLAAKLGTTVEMLWGVLLKQAPIAATINLIGCIAFTGLTVFITYFVKRRTTKPPRTEDDSYPHADWEDEGAFIAWVVTAGLIIATVVFVGVNAQNIVAGFFNPQYWALTQIMGK